jgi:serine/threonine protein kinase
MTTIRQIGEYNIIRELGRGRFAVVYLVEDQHKHRYSLKVLHAFLATEKGVKKFRREALINRRLFHPSIARVQRYIYFPDRDFHCLLMEYAEGEDLGEYLEKKDRLPVEDTIQIAWEVCFALEHAHSLGIVHRDLKPQNIIIRNGNKVKVTDFGLAGAASESIATLTAGEFFGTPYYMSTEQANREKGNHLSDLYSLGVIIYQMLTGRVPFMHEKASVVIDMHRKDTPTPILEIRPEVPENLANLVEKAMEKSPSDRFQSAKEMRQALEAIALDQGIDLHNRPVKEPIWDTLKEIFFRWHPTRLKDLVTNLGANVVWLVLSLLVTALLAFLGIREVLGIMIIPQNELPNAPSTEITQVNNRSGLDQGTPLSKGTPTWTTTPPITPTTSQLTRIPTSTPELTPVPTSMIASMAETEIVSIPTFTSTPVESKPTPTQKQNYTVKFVDNEIRRWVCFTLVSPYTNFSSADCIYTHQESKIYWTNNVFHQIRVSVYARNKVDEIAYTHVLDRVIRSNTTFVFQNEGEVEVINH